MEINFDLRGNLQPPDIIDMTLEEFKNIFLHAFDTSTNRYEIFASYEKFLTDLQNIITVSFTQWIDGSFISNRANPKDIDLITIVNFEIYEQNNRIFDTRFTSANARATYPYVDAYIVADYPPDHPKHIFTTSDLAYWRNFFGKTRVNRNRKQFPKGIIQIHHAGREVIR